MSFEKGESSLETGYENRILLQKYFLVVCGTKKTNFDEIVTKIGEFTTEMRI